MLKAQVEIGGVYEVKLSTGRLARMRVVRHQDGSRPGAQRSVRDAGCGQTRVQQVVHGCQAKETHRRHGGGVMTPKPRQRLVARTETVTEWRTTAYVQEQVVDPETGKLRWRDVETDGFGIGEHEVEINSDLADCQLTDVRVAVMPERQSDGTVQITDDIVWEEPNDDNDPEGDAAYGYEP